MYPENKVPRIECTPYILLKSIHVDNRISPKDISWSIRKELLIQPQKWLESDKQLFAWRVTLPSTTCVLSTEWIVCPGTWSSTWKPPNPPARSRRDFTRIISEEANLWRAGCRMIFPPCRVSWKRSDTYRRNPKREWGISFREKFPISIPVLHVDYLYIWNLWMLCGCS